MKIIVENFFCCMFIYCIFGKDRCFCKIKNLGIIKEFYNFFMVIFKMIMVIFIKNYYDV